MIQNNKINYILIFFIYLTTAFGWNEYNIYSIKTNEIKSDNYFVSNQTISNVDNADYLGCVVNYISGYGWRCSTGPGKTNNTFLEPKGNGLYFRRVPGASIFIYTHYVFFGKDNYLKAIKISQLLLYSISGCLLFYILITISNSLIISYLLSIFITTIPLYSGFLYYTITESITPLLSILYVFLCFYSYHKKNIKSKAIALGFAAIIIVAITLTRPMFGLLSFLIIYLIVKEYIWKLNFKPIIYISILPIMIWGSWIIRNYQITNEIVVLEQSTHPNTLSRYKPEFIAFWDFCKCWGEDGANMNSYLFHFYAGAMEGKTSDKDVKDVMKHIPKEIINEVGYNKLYNLLTRYYDIIHSQANNINQNIPLADHYTKDELLVSKELIAIKKAYLANHLIYSYINIPIKYLKDIVLHSNSSSFYIFEKQTNNNIALFITKTLMKIIHILAYLIIIINFFILKDTFYKLIWVYTPIILLIYLSVFAQMIEQRYMLPFYPILLTGIIFPMKKILMCSIFIKQRY